jgi:hypothetical protein
MGKKFWEANKNSEVAENTKFLEFWKFQVKFKQIYFFQKNARSSLKMSYIPETHELHIR